MAALEAYIAGEITTRMQRNVSWRCLEPCFKWQRIINYLREQGVLEDSPVAREIRNLLVLNQLPNVEYDMRNRQVLKLNHAGF